MSDLQVALTNTAGITSIISFWIFVASNAFKNWKPKILSSAFFVLLIGFIALTCAIVARGIEAQRFPLSNLYESLLWFAWAIMGAYLWLAATLNHAGVWHLGWLASLTAASFFLYGSWLPQSQHDIQPLVPALVSYWRQIHVPPLIVSYAMFFLSGLSGLVQLWWAGRRVSVYGLIVTIVLACSAIALKSFGLNLGICFQIVDDMLDITGDFDSKNKAGGVLKPLGGDLRNGVLTAPVLYALAEGGKDSDRLRKLIEDRLVVEDAGNQEGLSIISKSCAIEKTAELAQKYANDACLDISILPDSPYKEGLYALTEFIMSRAKSS
jgi:hypothetical protein